MPKHIDIQFPSRAGRTHASLSVSESGCKTLWRSCCAPSLPLAALLSPGQQAGKMVPVVFSTDKGRQGEQPVRLCKPEVALPLLQHKGPPCWEENLVVHYPDELGNTSIPAWQPPAPTAEGLSYLQTCSLSWGKCLSNTPTFRPSHTLPWLYVTEKKWSLSVLSARSSAVPPAAVVL